MFVILVSNLKKREVFNATEPKRPRYDNFLKSGSKYYTFRALDFPQFFDLRSS